MSQESAARTANDDLRQRGPVVMYADGSYESSEAAVWAAHLAVMANARLIAVRSWQPWIGEFRSQARDAVERRLVSELRHWVAPGIEATEPIRYQLVSGETEHALLEFSANVQALGIVVGLSSSTERLVHSLVADGRLPVAIVPLAGAARPLRRVTLGLDGSTGADAACNWLAEIVTSWDGEVHAVNVFEPLVEWVPADDPTSDWSRLRRKLAGAWVEPLRRSGVRLTMELGQGMDPSAGLAKLARAGHADFLVVGHERRRHERPWHTPLALRLAESAKLTVVCVPTS
jgi:nucleotide-binding universal stress UspA family protein